MRFLNPRLDQATTTAVLTFDFYVDYVNGNDTTGDGSSETPWKTVAKALTQMSNNNTLGVRDGSYYESNLATALTGITIQADNGHSPIMIPTTLYASGSWSKTGGQTNVYETAYTAAAAYVVHHGSTRLTLAADLAACDSTENSYYFDDPGNLLYVHVTGGAAPGDVHVDPISNYWLTLNGAGCTIKGITIDHFGRGINAQGGGTLHTITTTNVMPYANNTPPLQSTERP